MEAIILACLALHGPPEDEIVGGDAWIRPRGGQVLSVDFHPDGTRALSGSMDTLIRLWDVEKGKKIAA